MLKDEGIATAQKVKLSFLGAGVMNDPNEAFFKDRLYKSDLEAFHSGYYKLSELVDKDFSTYIENKNKENRKIQKLPRKIIRDFINACNASGDSNIVKNLNENIIFEERKNWKTIFETGRC